MASKEQQSESFVKYATDKAVQDCITIFESIRSQNQSQAVSIIKMTTSKAKQCAHQFNTLQEIKECSKKYREIDNDFYQQMSKLTTDTMDNYVGCITKCQKDYEEHKDSSKYSKSTVVCLNSLTSTLKSGIPKILNDEIKQLKAFK